MTEENGFGWLPSLRWRLDAGYSLLEGVPHLKQLPSKYIRENIYISPQLFEEPHRLPYFCDLFDQLSPVDNVVFTSDYPHWDTDDPDEAFPVPISPGLQRKSYFENAPKLYGLQ
ncbi:MAG TPA: amidohydrolase family protein [Chloroflexota bacterium]|nr:amidohydrolase family protein [Chloroflexota bacterium]